jgi:uncharacterized membrane protein
MIRQNASTNAAVQRHMLHVLTAVVSTERDHERMKCLRQQADIIEQDARRNISTPADLQGIVASHRAFVTMLERGPLGQFQPRR